MATTNKIMEVFVKMCAQHQVKVMALKVTNNIATLIKDLFHTPPSYKVVVTPSWKSPVAVVSVARRALIFNFKHFHTWHRH